MLILWKWKCVSKRDTKCITANIKRQYGVQSDMHSISVHLSIYISKFHLQRVFPSIRVSSDSQSFSEEIFLRLTHTSVLCSSFSLLRADRPLLAGLSHLKASHWTQSTICPLIKALIKRSNAQLCHPDN